MAEAQGEETGRENLQGYVTTERKGEAQGAVMEMTSLQCDGWREKMAAAKGEVKVKENHQRYAWMERKEEDQGVVMEMASRQSCE
jgi:hypothetical protein